MDTQIVILTLLIDNCRKNMSFVIEDDSVLVKYNDICNKNKEALDITFRSKPVYNEKCIKK